MPRPPRKYQLLADYLAVQDRDEITLTLAEIEQIVGIPLPPLASTRRFWANSARGRGHPVYAWQSVGWRVATADMRHDRVTFRRDEPLLPEAPHGAPPR